MLSRTLRDHQTRQSEVRLKNEILRKNAVESVEKVSNSLVDILNSRVSKIFANQKQLEVEAKTLQTLSTRYTKQTAQWISTIENFNNALKELGDIQSWAQSIESDMRTIASALEYVHQGGLSLSEKKTS